ncbi:arsenate reductase ArsC [candidate division TA06 bacterium]|uniref:Arsenate reductase ArsC n=1 Tax=candidate division TA06 bacterium TaxID=2250710 RepID=A0A933MKK7_UNCT6|nr:arsenate reductase ArsC [candidate division TA06 bacterium]
MSGYRKPVKVLFLCVANSARSQMAEGLLRHLREGRFEAYSAGTRPAAVHPLAIRVMSEIGIDISRQQSKSVSQYLGTGHFGCIISLCGQSEGMCPTSFPDISVRLHWDLPGPAQPGTEEEQISRFRLVRDRLKQLISGLINELGQ